MHLGLIWKKDVDRYDKYSYISEFCHHNQSFSNSILINNFITIKISVENKAQNVNNLLQTVKQPQFFTIRQLGMNFTITP